MCLTLEGRKHFKIGVCHGKVANRFRREPDGLHVEVLRVWEHPSQDAAHFHEGDLFRNHPGDRPYIGRCGPLTKGGNGETFSHDVLGGEPSPKRFLVRMLSDDDLPLYTYGYGEANPKEPYRHLHGEVRYMDYAFGPEGGVFYQVPGLSHPDSVTLCTHGYMLEELDNLERKRAAWAGLLAEMYREAAQSCIVVSTWEGYSRMQFRALSPFSPERYANWV